MRVSTVVCGVFSLLAVVALTDAEERPLTVKHRTASTVYVTGGSADGLAIGDRLIVSSRNAVVGELEVVFIAERSASCKVVKEVRPIAVGDEVRSTRKPSETSEPTAAETPGPRPIVVAPPVVPAATPPPSARLRWRGGISAGWNKLWDDTELQQQFEQRTGRLDVAVYGERSFPLELSVRARSRQDLRTMPTSFETLSSDERLDRVYELALRYRPEGSRVSFELGRVGVSSLGIGYLDGGVGELRVTGPLRLGGFGGRRADVDGMGDFASGTKYGGYLRFTPNASHRFGAYDALVFAAREMAASDVSREYVGLQGRWTQGRLATFQWAEVDVLRGWRRTAGTSAAQLSNLTLSASYRFRSSTSLQLSYDERRNYRTAETRSISNFLFDTLPHRGLRGALNVTRTGGFGGSAFVTVRMLEGSSDPAYSYGGGLRHANVFGSGLSGGLDGYGFRNGFTTGYQASLRTGRTVRAFTADVSAGMAHYSFDGGVTTPRTNRWLRMMSFMTFPRGFFVSGQAEYAHGDDTRGPRGGLEIGYRF